MIPPPMESKLPALLLFLWLLAALVIAIAVASLPGPDSLK